MMAVNNLFMPCDATWINCIGNQICHPSHYYEPENMSELQIHIRNAISDGCKIRVAGGGYSLSDLVCTNGYLLNLKKLNHILSVDRENASVYVEAGITMKELNERLAEYGLALSNQAAIDNITLGGALSSAVHGTGHTGTLSSFIKEIDLMTTDGKINNLSLKSDAHAFAAAKVSLGALGIIYAVKLHCEPLFYLKSIEEEWDINALILEYKKLNEHNDFFQFSWNIASGKALVTRRNRSKELEQNLFLSDTEICYKALACYTIDESDKDLFSEIAVPVDDLPKVIEKIKNFAKKYQTNGIKIADVVVRFVEADDSFLSPAANRSVAYLTMSIPIEYNCPLFYEEFEDSLLEDEGRPHWGKTNFLDYKKASRLYGENLEKFISVKRRLDPLGTFSNHFIDRICNGSSIF
ncbi:MAG: D-arabinono-1,4-lactone oxidase [Chlamydiales bacterium]